MAEFGARPDKGVNRQIYSDADRAARAELNRWAGEMGLELYTDPIANQFFRLTAQGVNPGLPPVVTGSHLDSQPTGGRYDGVYGVVAGFEAVQALIDSGAKLNRPVEIVAWSNEEGSRFAPGCMGSMCFTAAKTVAELADITDADGLRLEDELNKTLASHPEMQQRDFSLPVSAYIELHIEQGPVLEALGKPIGIVSGIQGCRWFNVSVNGEARHAGTTPLKSRRDALRAAVSYISELQHVMHDPDDVIRFTIGRMEVFPNSPNTVAERVNFSIDLRHPDDAVLECLSARIHNILSHQHERCQAQCMQIFTHAPVRFHAGIVSEIETQALAQNLAFEPMMSGAFHDALFMADHCPSAMIFVPSRDGISHHPSEFTPQTDLFDGTRLLASVLERLAA
jgi:N-carbamoyl-L-amino-acid hydrolase